MTTDFYSPAVRKAMGDLGLAPKDKTGGEGPLEVPIHISLFDATGEGGLIEFERDKVCLRGGHTAGWGRLCSSCAAAAVMQ